MKPTKSMTLPLAVAMLAAAWAVAPRSVAALQSAGGAQVLQPDDALEARVWLDRGEEPVVQPGDEVRVYYRTSGDAFAAIFRIDTDGEISLVFPQHPDVDPWVGGGRDYRLLFPNAPRWVVREDPGVGYFFMVASAYPLDFSAFGYDVEEGWDLGGVARMVYEDPYVAIDDYVAAILPEWETTPYALDFLEYSVGEEHDFPRFLCYDCHGFQRYSTWNPYVDACSSFQIVVWQDPYFLPRYRYVDTRVVFARPFGPRPRYTVTTRVLGQPWGPLVRTRPAPPRRIVEYKESARSIPLRRPSSVVPGRGPATLRGAPAQRSEPRAGPARAAPGRASPSRAPTRAAPDRATLGRSPGRALPSRALPGRAGPDRTRPGQGQERPSLQRRAPSERIGRPGGSAGPDRPPPAVRAPRGGPAGPSRPQASPPSRGSSPPVARPGGAANGRSGPAARPSRPPPRIRPGGSAAPARGAAPPRARPSGAGRPPPRLRSNGPAGTPARSSAAGRPPPRSGAIGARSGSARGPGARAPRGRPGGGDSGRRPRGGER